MKAEELVKLGNLTGALEVLQDDVRKHPSDYKLRVFLFQLLCVQGQWDRAIRQLKVCAELKSEALPMAQAYREVIACEVYRAKVFTSEKKPLIFGEPEEWIAMLIEALRLDVGEHCTEAQDMREKAFEIANSSSGTLNDQKFNWIADADPRLGPALEIIVNGRYFWSPFSAFKSIRIESPTDLRDLVWAPANVQWSNGGEVVAFIPVRYPGTVEEGSDALRLSRTTEWIDSGGGSVEGIGHRMLATDVDDFPLLETQKIEITGPENV